MTGIDFSENNECPPGEVETLDGHPRPGRPHANLTRGERTILEDRRAATWHERQTMTVREAAKVLGVNVKTLYAEIAAGRFPAIRLGRVLRITRSVLASFLEQGRVVPTGGVHAGKTRS